MLERTVGDIRITRVIESERPDFDAAQFFPSITAEEWGPYRQRLAGWDHMSVHITSKGQEAVITGDLIHSPVQCLEMEWVPRPDYDPPQAAATRHAFMERYRERDVVICASHFPSPSFGRFVREGKGFWFEYLKA
jgi:hypothetical protein